MTDHIVSIQAISQAKNDDRMRDLVDEYNNVTPMLSSILREMLVRRLPVKDIVLPRLAMSHALVFELSCQPLALLTWCKRITDILGNKWDTLDATVEAVDVIGVTPHAMVVVKHGYCYGTRAHKDNILFRIDCNIHTDAIPSLTNRLNILLENEKILVLQLKLATEKIVQLKQRNQTLEQCHPEMCQNDDR
jgi:hypothetical protein